MNDCKICGSLAECHHIKTRKAWPQYKDCSWNHMYLCRKHHSECHLIGLTSFVEKYGLQVEMIKRNFFLCNNQWKMNDRS